MRDGPFTIHHWTAVLLILALAPVAAFVGAWCDWTPGAAALAVLVVPVCAAGLSGHRATAVTMAVLAAVGGLAAAIVLRGSAFTAYDFVFPAVAAASQLLVAWITSSHAGRCRLEQQRLEERNADFARQLYRREREPEAAGGGGTGERSETTALATKSARRGALRPNPLEAEQIDTVNYAMLLLTLQDIGRRISTNLDIETLLPTIVSTAKVSLKCRDCRVFLWDGRTRTLEPALPDRARDADGYVPRPESGMARWVLEHRQILTRQSAEEDYTLRALLDEDPQMADAMAPLAVGGELLGLIVIDGIECDGPNAVRLLYILSNIYALGIKNAQLFRRIEDMARRDGLTGLLNHASFQQELLRRCESAAQGESPPVTVIMSDIDHFKKFNDQHGHQAGDQVLREVSRLWKAVLPNHAILARYGGEEFICALPGDDLSRGVELAELLRTSIQDYVVDFEGRTLHVTSSFGVAQFGRPATTTQELIRLADEALYRAKHGGRNRVVPHEAETIAVPT